MNGTILRHQKEVFGKAKSELGDELEIEMRSWGLLRFFEEFRYQAFSRTDDRRHAVRSFCSKFMKLKGHERYMIYKKWMMGRGSMSVDDFKAALRAVMNARRATKSATAKPASEKPAPTNEQSKEISRKAVDTVISMFGHCEKLFLLAGIKPQEITDGDKIEVRNSIRRMCGSFGISVEFPQPKTKIVPVTRGEI